jgi:hypothetical protein
MGASTGAFESYGPIFTDIGATFQEV